MPAKSHNAGLLAIARCWSRLKTRPLCAAAGRSVFKKRFDTGVRLIDVIPSESRLCRDERGISPPLARLFGFLAGLFLLVSANLFAQSKPAWPKAEDVLSKALERAKWSEQQNFDGKYTFTQRSTIEELDSRDHVKRHAEAVHHVFPIDGEPYAQPIQQDGGPLPEKEARQEQERQRKFRQQVAEKRRKKQQGKKDDDNIEFNEELLSRYRFDVTGHEAVNGRPAYVLSFQPKSGKLPVKRKLDRLLNKLAGQVWVDEQDYEISRADLHLAENVSAWGGLLASVRKFVVRFEQAKVDNTAWLPSFLDAHVDGRILIKSVHLKLTQQNSDFRKVVPEAGRGSSGRP